MLPYAAICQTERMRSLALGTSWLRSEVHTHSIASTKQLFAPC